jgi:hypothetical protein
MCQEKNSLEKFLKNLEKYENNEITKYEIKKELSYIMNMDYNINPNISVEHYKNLYPHFNEKVHKLLSRCAKMKKHDYRKTNQLSIKRGKFIIEYN